MRRGQKGGQKGPICIQFRPKTRKKSKKAPDSALPILTFRPSTHPGASARPDSPPKTGQNPPKPTQNRPPTYRPCAMCVRAKRPRAANLCWRPDSSGLASKGECSEDAADYYGPKASVRRMPATSGKPDEQRESPPFEGHRGGEGGIRTPGGHKAHAGFQDRCLRPLGHLSGPDQGILAVSARRSPLQSLVPQKPGVAVDSGIECLSGGMPTPSGCGVSPPATGMPRPVSDMSAPGSFGGTRWRMPCPYSIHWKFMMRGWMNFSSPGG